MALQAVSAYLATKLLDHTLGGAAYTAPAGVYLALLSNSTTELTGSGYARQAITLGAAVGRSKSNSAVIEFPEATANWLSATHARIMDAVSGGNILYGGPLETARQALTGDVIRFKVGEIVVEYPATLT